MTRGLDHLTNDERIELLGGWESHLDDIHAELNEVNHKLAMIDHEENTGRNNAQVLEAMQHVRLALVALTTFKRGLK